MSDRSSKLLRDIQDGALDSSTSISDLLRKCMALGGASRSEKLVDWASSELNGYSGDADQLPLYRKVTAPLVLDAIAGYNQITGQHISHASLPEFARDYVELKVPLSQGVGTLQELISRATGDTINLSPPGSQELVSIWNRQRQSDTETILRLYWIVATSEIAGVLHQIRNHLVKFIAEFEIEFDAAESTGAAVDRAIQITMGAESGVAIVSSQGRSRNRVDLSRGVRPLDKPRWSAMKSMWAVLVGLATIAAAWFGYLALLP